MFDKIMKGISDFTEKENEEFYKMTLNLGGRDLLTPKQGIKRLKEIEEEKYDCFKGLSEKEKLDLEIILPLPIKERKEVVDRYLKCNKDTILNKIKAKIR